MRTTRLASLLPPRSRFGTVLLLWLAAPLGAQRPEPPPLELPGWETGHPFAPIPHPRDVFGFEPGADYRLATHDQIVEYFRALDAATGRVRVVEIGESVEGRPLILAFISSEANIARLDRLRQVSESLARGRVSEAEARRLAAEGRALVWVDGGLHSTEVAGAQHSPLLAYRVAGEETEEMRRIRDDVVLLLMPVMNPDGLDLVADWTARSRGTAWEGTSPPVLYHAYTGHDNNRDWFMITQPETRAVTHVLYHQWYPQIVYNQHQTAPWPARIFIPPFADPVNPHIPPLVVRGVNLVGDAMGKRFAEEGKPGAVSRLQFDMWWNGGMRTAPYFHNMVGILTETAHASVAPRYTPAAALPRFMRGIPAREPSVFYPDPWMGGWFRLRDAVEYMVTGAMAVLDVSSRLREDWLLNSWRMASGSVAAGEAGGPFAYIIPPDQRQPFEAVEMVNVLRRGGVEVHQAGRGFRAGGSTQPAGSYVVFAGQAFRPHVMDLLEPQVYPDMRLYPGGPPDPPYDISGWTLPIQMGVRTVRIDEPFQADALAAVDRARVWPGRLVGDSRWGWAVSPGSNASALAANRLLRAGESVSLAPTGLPAGDRQMEPGALVVRRGAETEARIRVLAQELGLEFIGLRSAPRSGLRTLELPRVGLYKSWVANMDEGWTRWVLERYEFPVDMLHDADIRTGDLSRYHAIIIPSQRANSILHGHRPGTRPAEITGGMGLEGVVRLQEYVRAGGRIVAFDAASELIIQQFGLPLRNAVDGLPSEEFFIPGTLIRIEIDTRDPMSWGMPEEAAAFFVRSSAFARTGQMGEVTFAATYASEDLVLSGWALGEDRHLAGRGALARVPLGAGEVVLFAFRPQFRAQPRGTFKLLFNALHGASTRDGMPLSGGEE